MSDFAPYINGVISDFEQENPDIKIKWVDIPFSEGEKRTLASVLSDNPPDLVNLNPDFSATLAHKGALQEISKADAWKALDVSQSSSFVKKMEKDLNSEIAQGGTNVSGGQKQRLSIARAIARNPEIYIFDDAFSALDFKTDYALRKELNKECSGATKVIVASRIGTIMDADKILVLDDGKCVGIGKHDELLKTCKVYKEIALSQLGEEAFKNA